MNGTLAGIVRLDRDRPWPATPDRLFGAAAACVVHEDVALRLLAPDGVDVPRHRGEAAQLFEIGKVTDTLVPAPDGLPGLWSEHGDALAGVLNGHFALVVREGERVHLLQDGFPGIVTLYVHERDGLLAFADRIEPLLRLFPEERTRLDERARFRFLADSYITAPRTIYARIRQLVAGEALTIGPAGVSRRVTAGWERPDARIDDPDFALRRYRELLEQGVDRILARHPDCGFLLSGGLDSSVNVMLGAARVRGPLRTFGITAEGFNTDAPWARRVADLSGAVHTEAPVTADSIDALPLLARHMENPFYEPGMILSWSALKLASAHVDAVIGGEATDQLFGACALPARNRFDARRRLGPLFGPWRAAVRAVCANPLTRDRVFLRKVENRLIGDYDVDNWCGRYGFRDCDLTALLRRPVHDASAYDALDLPDHDLDALFTHGCTVLNRDYALSGILVANGRLGDLLGLKTWSPYLDRRVADFVLSLATELRSPEHPELPGTYVYKALHRRLARSLLPADVVDRPKQGGAVDPRIHLRDPRWSSRIRRAVLASPVLDDLCRREPLEALFADPVANATRILQLVAYDLWHHLFIERAGDDPGEFPLAGFLEMRATG